MRGASAIAGILESREGASIRVFAVWEPVIWTDAFRPADPNLVKRIPDARVAHYWDPKKSLSREILQASWTKKYVVRGGPMGTVWDWVSCYPAGMRWAESFPEPVEQGFPVLSASGRVHAWLERALAEGQAPEERPRRGGTAAEGE